jgi:hypothetical protein
MQQQEQVELVVVELLQMEMLILEVVVVEEMFLFLKHQEQLVEKELLY